MMVPLLRRQVRRLHSRSPSSKLVRHSTSFLRRTLKLPLIPEKAVGIGNDCYLPVDTIDEPLTDEQRDCIAKGFNFTIKQTANDFVVREVTPQGEVVKLTRPIDQEEIERAKTAVAALTEEFALKRTDAFKELQQVVTEEVANKISACFSSRVVYALYGECQVFTTSC